MIATGWDDVAGPISLERVGPWEDSYGSMYHFGSTEMEPSARITRQES